LLAELNGLLDSDVLDRETPGPHAALAVGAAHDITEVTAKTALVRSRIPALST